MTYNIRLLQDLISHAFKNPIINALKSMLFFMIKRVINTVRFLCEYSDYSLIAYPTPLTVVISLIPNLSSILVRMYLT